MKICYNVINISVETMYVIDVRNSEKSKHYKFVMILTGDDPRASSMRLSPSSGKLCMS